MNPKRPYKLYPLGRPIIHALMGKRASREKVYIALAVFLVLYACLSLSFLVRFPLVHSDEAWLAGLTRDMMADKSFGVTESFFDAKPRIPHAIRSLFHCLQMGYISLAGFNIWSVRLLSLTGALLCLVLLFLIGRELKGPLTGFGLMTAVGIDIQFIYASHFARQEILICLSLLACLFLLLKCQGRPTAFQAVLLALITGLSVGVHPNSFLCAAMCGCVMLLPVIRRKGTGLCPLAVYICVTGALAAVFIGLSFSFDPHFIPDYFRYGEQEFELNSSLTGRLSEFLYYFKSIYNRESGTYYLPDLRLELILMSLAASLLIPLQLFLRGLEEPEVIAWRGNTQLITAAMAGLAAGVYVIGRFNQTSILFFLILGWIGCAQILFLFEAKGRVGAFITTLCFLMWSSGSQIYPVIQTNDFSRYLNQHASLIPSDASVLGGINLDFYVKQGKLKDYRNLPYLETSQSLAQYIKDNEIQYICYTDELDFIYENRPYYNVIYGNAAFIPVLKDYCETNCDLAGTFENPSYGPRIISLVGHEDYGTVYVYRVRDTVLNFQTPSSLPFSPGSKPASPLSKTSLKLPVYLESTATESPSVRASSIS